MIVLLGFAFVSGLITIFAPCIWPILPVILASSATGSRRKAIGVVAGVAISFAAATLFLSSILRVFPFDPDVLRLLAVVIIGVLGLTLIIPQLGTWTESLVSRLSGKLQIKTDSGLLTGLALGVVWSPCAGPILATIAALSVTQKPSLEVILLTLAYALGIGIPLLALALAGQGWLAKSRWLSPYTGIAQRVFGVIMLLTAVAIYTNYDKVLQAKLLDYFPSYTNFLIKLEAQPQVLKQLEQLKSLPSLGGAAGFTGGTTWLNSDPLTLNSLRGKVVLVDFWTYTCINCIRTLPHVVDWYEKYKDKGLVVVGVHTPEFEFEKKTANVAAAIKQHHISYPVVQDNGYVIWNAYRNVYWPAKYLIDATGQVRYTHFGEGKYIETEMAIRQLLTEAGFNPDESMSNLLDRTPRVRLTPETYLGRQRGRDSWVKFSGDWQFSNENAYPQTQAELNLSFTAAKVYLVISGTGKFTARLDSQVMSEFVVDHDGAYQLVDLSVVGSHQLQLQFPVTGLALYAFTFGD